MTLSSTGDLWMVGDIICISYDIIGIRNVYETVFSLGDFR